MTKLNILFFLSAFLCWGQTQISLSSQSKSPDLGAKTNTRPIQTGSTLPAACGAGELFFHSTAESGKNIYGCVGGNVWQPMTGLGQCSVTGSTLTCPGTIVAGDGTAAGEIRVYEKTVSGNDFVSWSAPDSIAATYRLRLPGSAPSAAAPVLVFGTPVDGFADASWQPRLTKSVSTLYFPAARGNGAQGWAAGTGWSVGTGAGAATIAGGGTSPFQTGYLSFPGGVKTYAVLQFVLPSNWDQQTVTARLLWAANDAADATTVKWELSAACGSDGASLLNPSFATPQQTQVTVPYPNDTSFKRITTTFSPLTLTGCAVDNVVYLLLDRDGAADTNSAAVHLFGLRVDFLKGLQ
ncbi:MAG: hypothetical protein JNK48_01520 [Bryobacterales bacterium]|nr:hypothetical protein [Bryobacterales bacterium]